MASHLVIGSGPTGVATARLLVEQGHSVKVVSRSERASEPGIEHLVLDATNSHALSQAAMGVSAIYNCANPAYHRWVTDWRPLATAMNDAAEASGAVLVVLNNLYSY